MKIATILFTYNRSWHTEQVLKALSQNYELPEKLFIFQDGIKKKEHEKEWKKVNCLIDKVVFCPVEIIVSKENKGLAKSIMSGINYVFQQYDAIIVLEDDCVPTKNFIGFMNQSLYRYKNVKNVYNVTGFGYSSEFESRGCDAYFVGRTCSWGWGTWNDRWEGFSPSTDDLKAIVSDKKKSEHLSAWGNDLPIMLLDQVNGRNDSWAVYWALYVINRQGFCLAPYSSLIENIGMDGTGVHCGISNEFEVNTEKEDKKIYTFPDKLEYKLEASIYFMDHFGGYTANNHDSSKEHIIIYGLGNFFKRNEKYFCDHYYIEAFIDRARNGYYAGKEIIQLDGICKYLNCQIFILIIDMGESGRISKLLVEKYGVKKERISKICIES